MSLKKTTSAIALFAITVIGSYAQDAYAIMKRVDEANSPSTTHALVQMILTDRRGNQNERIIEEWSAEDSLRNKHSVMVFHSPASVRNTRFLTVENSDRNNDQWIFLPGLNRVRRISSSDKGSSFVGTEFTYYDLQSRNVDDYVYGYRGTETVQGYECHVIEIRPKSDTESPYSLVVSWATVDEGVNSVIRSEFFEKEDELLKVMTVHQLEQVSGYWIPVSMTMENVQENRSTMLIQQRLELDQSINPVRFTQRFLETGGTAR